MQPTLPPAGGGSIGFESTAPISAATGSDFTIIVVAAGASEAYQGYQWTLHTGPNVTIANSQADAANTGFATCAKAGGVGPSLSYGGCVSVGQTAIYNGRLETVTIHCDAPGALTLKFANVLEGNGFSTSFLRTGSEEFGGPSSDSVSVTCT